ncbi:SAM-dependent methyltransferase [Kribbella sp. NPDC056861]|uniref:SAM-dependent methyltransferase n=1 Tax=Kribbella sp. NPDC056861 TaxID=3154857 RepID=UPI00342836D2
MPEPASGQDPVVAPGVDVSRPSIARVYDAFLGGKDNFESDRAVVRQILRIAPELPAWTRENRRWLARVVEWLAREARITRFLDLGSGLPTAQNTHQLAQRVNPAAKVGYVDNDPAVIAHGRALLLENANTFFVPADFTTPDQLLADPVVAGLLDRPVGLIQALILHHVEDLDQTRELVRRYVEALPSGSYLAISHACNPRDGSEPALLATALEEKFREQFPSLRFRTPAEITSYFDGLELLEPSVVRLFDWWPPGVDHDETTAASLSEAAGQILYCGLARKP